jgi:hypothetical protein
MFELIVEILHSDDRRTVESYRRCQVFEHSETGEKALSCKAFRYPTRDACVAQLNKLDADWRASQARDGKIMDWVEWRMHCEQVDGPPTS